LLDVLDGDRAGGGVVSTDTIFNLLYALVLISLATALWRLTRDEKPSEEERAADARRRVSLAPDCRPRDEWVYDGPDSLRLIEDLDAHMKAYGEKVADLYDTRGNRP
jgi:hypothetical protein